MIAVSQPTSAAEIRANAAAVRKRLFSPQKAPRAREEPKPAFTEAIEPEVDEAALTPVQFLKHLCRKKGVVYVDVTSPSRTAAMVKLRDEMVIAVYGRYPHLTISDLSRMFHRDRATVHKCLARCGVFLGARMGVADHADRIRQMLIDGATFAEIGRAINFTGTAVSEYVRTHGLVHLAHKKRSIDDHADYIKAMLMEGKTYPEIAAVINFDPSGICRFLKRKGWRR